MSVPKVEESVVVTLVARPFRYHVPEIFWNMPDPESRVARVAGLKSSSVAV